MPDLKTSPATTAAAAHADARVRAANRAYTTALTPLQQAHYDAIARANKVAARERHLITTFALSAEIEEIEDLAASAIRCGEIETGVALHAAARRFRALIPILPSARSV